MYGTDLFGECDTLSTMRKSTIAEVSGHATFAPLLLRRHHQPERHGEAGLAAEAALGALCPMSDGGERAPDRIGRAHVFPMFRGVVVEGQ